MQKRKLVAKRKAPSRTNTKWKKQALPAKVEHVLVHLKPLYLANKDREEALWKRDKDQKCILEKRNEIIRLQEESSQLKKMLKNAEAKWALEEAAMKKLTEANRTVNWIFRLDMQDEIQTNVIEEFLAEVEKTYHPILKAIVKFLGDSV
jgi:hypothetical protein